MSFSYFYETEEVTVLFYEGITWVYSVYSSFFPFIADSMVLFYNFISAFDFFQQLMVLQREN